MIYAQIKDGIVMNTIVVEDDSALESLLVGFDELIRIDTEKIVPAIGWIKEDEEIIAPPTDSVIYDPDAGPIKN